MKRLLFLSILLFVYHAKGQSWEEMYNAARKANTITFHDNAGSKFIFDVKDSQKHARTDRTYHWYQARQIHVSRGGYSGKLLDGDYTQFYANKGLATKGTFKNGLKSGKWKYWNEKGQLLKLSRWKKGKESGPYLLFDSVGRVMERGKFSEGNRDGKISIYSPLDSAYREQYFYRGAETTEEGYFAKQNIWKRTRFYIANQWFKLLDKKAK